MPKFNITLLRGPWFHLRSGRYLCRVQYGKTRQKVTAYARYLMENHLGRELDFDEHVDHIDENCTNDVISNLQILSRADNTRKSVILKPRRHQRSRVGKLTDKIVLRLRKQQKVDVESECKKYNVTRLTITNALSGNSFVHLPYANDRWKESNGVLTDHIVLHLRKKKNIDLKQTCLDYDINRPTLTDALSGKSFSHLPYAHTRWRKPVGENHRKFTTKQVIKLRTTSNLDRDAACIKYGVCRRVLENMLCGITYKEIPYAIKRKKRKNFGCKLTDEQVIAIRSCKNLDKGAACVKYNVSASTIDRILWHQRYKHLPTVAELQAPKKRKQTPAGAKNGKVRVKSS